MSIKKQMDKEDMTYTYNEIYLSHEENEILPFVAIQIDLENKYYAK